MNFQQRFQKLKEMLGEESIIMFPDASKAIADELPLFSVLFDDIKSINQLQANAERQKQKAKAARMSKLDTGIPHAAEVPGLSKRGLNCDPTSFKDNVSLDTHLNECSIHLLKQKFETSEAIK